MTKQLEFDLVSPLLGEPTFRQMERVRKTLRLPAPLDAKQADELRSLTARLNYLDYVYDPKTFSLEGELVEVRVLVGREDWAKDKKIWTRRGRRDGLRLRKVILSMKRMLRLS